ncbi:RNA polymerase sigma factor [Brachybacterium vulturis]|uniref:RNA polymerase sigma factor n=1 Tax=Brachybacterium vulturis TaxID=2017484 RepID=UPI003736A30F
MNESRLRELVPTVIGILRRRGADFAAAEDAVQDALVAALAAWEREPPRDPQGWLVTVAWRKFLDQVRAEDARHHREERFAHDPAPGSVPAADDSLELFFLCAHPSLTPASAIALTLRAIGGLTTRQIAAAYLVPEATMAQRISRAKRTLAGQRLDRPGDVATVLQVLYLIFNEGYSGDVDLSGEAIRLTRQLRSVRAHPEVDGLLGEFQAQAAIAALHADAPSAPETDWPQILEWYDELVALTDSPIARLNRVVALGEVAGPRAGLAALAELAETLPRHAAVAAYLHEADGGTALAARLYAAAAQTAASTAERDHLLRQAARLNSA